MNFCTGTVLVGSVLAANALATVAATDAAPRLLMEAEASIHSRGVPRGWKMAERSPPEQELELLFAVKQSNLPALRDTLLKVSDPSSASYGRHLTSKQVHELVAPSPADLNAVKAFLQAHNVSFESVTPSGDFLQAAVTVAEAEAMLHPAQFYRFAHAETGMQVHRATGYGVPTALAASLDFVAPTVHMPPPPRRLLRAKAGVGALVNSPKAMREIYSVGDALGQAPSNKMAVTAFLEQHIHLGDLHEFWNSFCKNESLVCGKGDPLLRGDETTGLSAGVESMLDIETITGIAGNITSEFWGFSGRSPDNKENEPFMKWLSLMSNTSDADVPKVFSTSYGENENAWSLAAATRMNTEFQKAGVRGISLLFASGDEGANCQDGVFQPETPGSSPWVTAVGGTFESGKAAVGLSSGGFSNRWEQPAWQADAVKTYLQAAGLPPASDGYNVTGRAYPDIASQATDFVVIANGIPFPGVAGTSCASPGAAGVVALLNDARLLQGKSTLGFLNPWIYTNMDKWNDVAQGSSGGGCKGSGGWPAVKGWDAATGVGGANYQELINALDALS